MFAGSIPDPFGLYWTFTKRGDRNCKHHFEKVFEGPRPLRFLRFFHLVCWGHKHCDSRRMVYSECAVVLRCRCGAEQEAVYAPGRMCLVCQHAEDLNPSAEFAP